MDPNNAANQSQTGIANLVSVLVTPEQIKNGAFLLSRLNSETHALTEIKVVNNRGNVPPSTQHSEYKLIGMGEGVPGAPLDDLIDDYCTGWDGVTPITLYFNRADAIFARYELGAVAAATGR